jgi:hypothetical protein
MPQHRNRLGHSTVAPQRRLIASTETARLRSTDALREVLRPRARCPCPGRQVCRSSVRRGLVPFLWWAGGCVPHRWQEPGRRHDGWPGGDSLSPLGRPGQDGRISVHRPESRASRAHTDDGYAGTGLGLSICRHIIERHAGIIAATDNPGPLLLHPPPRHPAPRPRSDLNAAPTDPAPTTNSCATSPHGDGRGTAVPRGGSRGLGSGQARSKLLLRTASWTPNQSDGHVPDGVNAGAGIVVPEVLSAGGATGWHSTVYAPPVQSTVDSPPHADTPTISNAVTTIVAALPRPVDDVDRLLMTFRPPLLLPLAQALPEQATACLKSMRESRAGGGCSDHLG